MMARIVTLHSYRGGTGKSSMAANVAFLAMTDGLRVGLVDTDVQSPDAHVLLGVTDVSGRCSLADYLIGRCEIEDAANLVGQRVGDGEIYLISARSSARDINDILNRGYDVGLLREGFERLIAKFNLDVLLLDTRSGVGNETVAAVAHADSLVIVTRADHLIAEASETISLTSRLTQARQHVVINMIPDYLPSGTLRKQAEEIYGYPVVAMLPYCADMAALGSQLLFARDYPQHRLVKEYQRVKTTVLRD
jgi:MinD-like ATPase involved in chromosome partitioning or flagellar assembly